MTRNVVVKRSSINGKGVFASCNFKAGGYILTIDDSHVVTDETKLTPKQHEFDLDYLADRTIIMQSPEKFINHSCNPNSFVKTKNSIRSVYAMRDITAGDEITYDYVVNGDNNGTFPCRCGSKNCRKIYQGNYFKLPLESQIKYLPYLEDWFIKKHKSKIDRIIKMRK